VNTLKITPISENSIRIETEDGKIAICVNSHTDFPDVIRIDFDKKSYFKLFEYIPGGHNKLLITRKFIKVPRPASVTPKEWDEMQKRWQKNEKVFYESRRRQKGGGK